MRTTLIIDDELLRKAKHRAAERHLTVSDVVNDALRESFIRPRPPAEPFSLVTYGRPGKHIEHSATDFANAIAQEDTERLR